MKNTLVIILFTLSFTVNADWIDQDGLQWRPVVLEVAPGVPYRVASFNEVSKLVSGINDFQTSHEFFLRTRAKVLQDFSRNIRFGRSSLHYARIKDSDGNTWQIRDALTCLPWPNNNVCATHYVDVYSASQKLGGIPIYVKPATTESIIAKFKETKQLNGSVFTVDVDSISTQPATVLIQFNDGPWTVLCGNVPCSFSTPGAIPGERSIRVEQSEEAPRIGEIMDDEITVNVQ